MAPLAGLVRTPLSSQWNRMAGLVWERGGPIYNFQGLRSFKNKFRPVWEPRYLAASGAIGPFITLADVATLASGLIRRSSLSMHHKDRRRHEVAVRCTRRSVLLLACALRPLMPSMAAATGRSK